MLVTTLAAVGLCAAPPTAFLAAAAVADDDSGSAARWAWLVSPSPVLVLADAVPRSPDSQLDRFGWDPLGHLGEWARSRSEPRVLIGEDSLGHYSDYGWSGGGPPPVWPGGLAVDLLLGAAALTTAVRRAERTSGSPGTSSQA